MPSDTECIPYVYRNPGFDEARTICQAEEADLTIISDESENDFVAELFRLVSFVLWKRLPLLRVNGSACCFVIRLTAVSWLVSR